MRRRHRQIEEVNFLEFKGLANFNASNRSSIKYAYRGKNCFFDRGKILSSPGHSPFLPALPGVKNYRNLSRYEHTLSGVTTEYLMTLYDKEWFSVDSEAATRNPVVPKVTTDEPTDAKQYINTLYTVSPTDGGFKITDPTTIAAVSTIPKGTMIEFAWEKMWITGVEGSEATLFGSKTATAVDPTNVEIFAGGEVELVGKGGRNTGMILHDDVMYIFKKNNIHFIRPETISGLPVYFPKPFALTAGAVNNDSVIVVENDVWFLTPENQIRTLGEVVDYSGKSRANDITEIIREMKDQLAQDQSAFSRMHYHDKIVTIALAEKGSSAPNIVIKYNITTGGFAIDRFPSVNGWATVNNKVFMSTLDSGQLYQDRFGYSFGDNFDIPFQVDMPFVDFDKPYLKYRNREIFARIARSKGVTTTIRLYKGDYDTFTDYTIPEPTAEELGTTNNAPIGKKVIGSSPVGGSGSRASDKPAVYIIDFLISTSHVANMFALGILADLNGQRIEVEQLTLGLLPASSRRYNL